MPNRLTTIACTLGFALAAMRFACVDAQPAAVSAAARAAATVSVATVPGMPPVPDPKNLYSETASGKLSPAVAGALERVYVPNRTSRTAIAPNRAAG